MAAVPVMVLACNEERNIAACLDSVLAAEPGESVEVFVLANGCTDDTEDIVRRYAAMRPDVHLISLVMKDKCNAWNVFMHGVIPQRCPGREVYVFMNGDARVVPGSISAMVKALQNRPRANAASAVPASGRNRELDRNRILVERGLVANLYALRGAFVDRLILEEVRLPLKLEGDDGLLGALVKWDLAPGTNELDDTRIEPCADAAFAFTSMSPLRPADWLGYWRRTVRYARRRYEFDLLGKQLRALGLAGMPVDVTELYSEAARLRLRWQGLYTIPSVVAWCQIQRIGQERREAR